MNKIKILVMGGLEKEYHDFSVQGPLIRAFLEKAGFIITLSEDLNMFLPSNLKGFDVIICMTTARTLNKKQEQGLLNEVIGSPWSKTGKPKGFIGIHGASVSFPKSKAYLNMLGARFLTHPAMEEYHFCVELPKHPIMVGITDFSVQDELYLMEIYPPFEVLLSCNFQGFKRPVAWCKPYGLGRVFYTALGHGEQTLNHALFQKMVINAIRWSLDVK